MQLEPLISILGVMHRENELEVLSVMRVEATSKMGNAKATDLNAELTGEDGEILASSPVFRLRDQAHGDCDCESEGGRHYPYMVQAFLKDVGPGAELRIQRGGEGLWSRRAPEDQPRITDFVAEITKDQLVAEWRLESRSDLEPELWIQASSDGGETWNAVASRLRGESVELGLSSLPPGDLEVRLFASDGFHTATSVTLSLEVPVGEAAVSILAPRDGQTLVAGSSMRLHGAATPSSDSPGEITGANWILDGEEIVEGTDAFITAPDPGEHELTLQATVDDQSGEASVLFITVGPPSEDEIRQYKLD